MFLELSKINARHHCHASDETIQNLTLKLRSSNIDQCFGSMEKFSQIFIKDLEFFQSDQYYRFLMNEIGCASNSARTIEASEDMMKCMTDVFFVMFLGYSEQEQIEKGLSKEKFFVGLLSLYSDDFKSYRKLEHAFLLNIIEGGESKKTALMALVTGKAFILIHSMLNFRNSCNRNFKETLLIHPNSSLMSNHVYNRLTEMDKLINHWNDQYSILIQELASFWDGYFSNEIIMNANPNDFIESLTIDKESDDAKPFFLKHYHNFINQILDCFFDYRKVFPLLLTFEDNSSMIVDFNK